jgi:hypothetical protein
MVLELFLHGLTFLHCQGRTFVVRLLVSWRVGVSLRRGDVGGRKP